MTVPTEGECFSRLIEYIRLAQEEAAMISHLHNANDRPGAAMAWLKVSENLRKAQYVITSIAQGRLQ